MIKFPRAKLLLFLFFSLLFIFLINSSYADYVSDEVIVKFKNHLINIGATNSNIPMNSINIRSQQVLNVFISLEVQKIEQAFQKYYYNNVFGNQIKTPDLSLIYLLKLKQNSNIENAISALRNLPEVEYAQPNYLIHTFLTPNDTYYSSQWALPKISAEAAWDIETGSSESAIAIIDTGVAYTHEDLINKITLGYDFVNSDNDPYDDNGHGTHTAGIAGALANNSKGIAGMNWQIPIMAIKVLNYDGVGSSINVANGLVYAADNNAKTISMSFGYYEDNPTIKDAIIYAYSKGCTLVGAAGNDNTSTPTYPAAYNDYVIAVAATDQNDLRSDWGTSSSGARIASNYGTWVDVCAPGTSIYSLYPPNTYATLNGTSMATPFVAGLASLLLAKNKTFSQQEIRNQIENSCDNIDNLNPSFAGLLGHGRINAVKALGLPTARITSPSDKSYLSGTVSIKGTAASTDFLKYQLLLGYGTTPGTFETLIESLSEVSNDTLYTFDTSNKNDGIYNLKIIVQSKTNLSSESSITITIDNASPEAVLTSPQNESTLEGLIAIKGNVSDTNFDRYTLSYAKDTDFITILNSSTIPASDILGYWNTSGIRGNYRLKLTVLDFANHESSQTININIISGTASSVEIQGFSKPTYNPFNPSLQSETYIYYNLSNNSSTSLYVFNLTGELIYSRSFESGEMGGKSGDNLAPWNGKDMFGTVVHNGIYIYKIIANNPAYKKVIGSGRIIVIR